MKTTEIIKSLQSAVEEYGDLNFSISIETSSGEIQDVHPEEQIIVVKNESSEEINLRNFIY